jgi:hypothetical protein
MKNRNLNHSDNWATPKEFYDKLNAEFAFDFEIRFIKGRVKFVGVNTKGELVNDKAPMHDSMIVVFGGKQICN